MSAPLTHLTTVISLFAFTACGAGQPADAPSTGSPGTPGTAAASASSVRACDLLDLATATIVLGTGTEHPGGDTERETCIYVNPGVATLTIQIGSAQLYDQITILPPHTPTSIGDRGRHNVQASGAAAVQFAKGSQSVTISVQPIGSPAQDYLPPLLNAAQHVAGQLP